MNGERDQQLLSEYAEQSSEAAFGELVRRYVDFVYSAAFRMVRNPHLAEEVTQSVFVALSQNARALSGRAVLSGWLHRTARNLAAKTVRGEVRRRAREQEAVVMNELSSSEVDPLWERLAPELDAALDELKDADRNVVLLRFFHQCSVREIAEALGLNEDTAKKRVARALQRLRGVLALRGVTVSVGLLVTALAARSVEAAPAGLAAAVASASSAGAGSSAAIGTFSHILKLVAMTKFQATVLALLFVAGVATPGLVSSGSSERSRAQFDAESKEARSAALQTNRQTAAIVDGSVGAQFQANTPLSRLQAFMRQTDQGHAVGGVTSDEQEALVFLVWSLPAADYPKAWSFRKNLTREGLRDSLEQTLLKYWIELDPPAALAAAESVTRYSGENQVSKWLGNWVEKDPAAALTWVQQEAPEAIRSSALATVLPNLARTDPQAAIAALAEMPASQRKDRTLSEVVEQWAAQDPAAAANYATNLPFSMQRSKAVASVAEIWAKKDYDAVLSWAQKLPEADQASVRDGALRVMEEKDPAQAAAILQDLGRSNDISRTLQNWAKTDLGEAANWVKQLPQGRFYQLALSGLLPEWGNRDPRSAAEFVAAMPAEKGQLQIHFQEVLPNWAGKDLQAATDWAKRLPDDSVRDSALNAVCGALALSKPAEAASLVASLAPGDEQSRLAAGVAGNWACHDPMAAVQWVAAFPEGPSRTRAIGEMARFFQIATFNLDPCRRWLNGTSLFSAEEKQEFLSK
jgi:RNA polymerase sigma factor (sigma-70 family)